MLIWITGLSGSGKTTLATALVDALKPRLPNLVLLDGDGVRAALGGTLGYTVPDRLAQISRLQALASLLERQGIVVIVAAVYSTAETSAWNRAHFDPCYEIQLRASLPFLQRRDAKRLYSAAAAGQIRDVVGVDIPWHPSHSPDLVIDAEAMEPPALLAARVAALDPLLRAAIDRG